MHRLLELLRRITLALIRMSSLLSALVTLVLVAGSSCHEEAKDDPEVWLRALERATAEGRKDEAFRIAVVLTQETSTAFPKYSKPMQLCYLILAATLADKGELRESEFWLERAATTMQRLGTKDSLSAWILSNYGYTCLALHDFALSERVFRLSLSQLGFSDSCGGVVLPFALEGLSIALSRQGRLEEAASIDEQRYQNWTSCRDISDSAGSCLANELCGLYAETGKCSKCFTLYGDLALRAQNGWALDPGEFGPVIWRCALCKWVQGDFDSALDLFAEAEKVFRSISPGTYSTRQVLFYSSFARILDDLDQAGNSRRQLIRAKEIARHFTSEDTALVVTVIQGSPQKFANVFR